MSHDHNPVELDQSQIQRAEHGWEAFTKYGKWGTVHVVVLLILMAVFLL